MRSLVFGACALIGLGFGGSASAQSYETWTSVSGFEPGDEGATMVTSEGLTVSWVAERSYADGRMKVIGEFCNNSGFDWEGGMRLTHIEPDRAHLTLRVPARDCVKREEIIPTGVDRIYIFLNEY